MRVLVVEADLGIDNLGVDNLRIGELVKDELTREGYTLDSAREWQGSLVTLEQFSLITCFVLDSMLPGVDRFTIAKTCE
jgi:DNA-binding response OmpR family regulator